MVLDFRYSLTMPDVVLGHGSRIFPDHGGPRGGGPVIPRALAFFPPRLSAHTFSSSNGASLLLMLLPAKLVDGPLLPWGARPWKEGGIPETCRIVSNSSAARGHVAKSVPGVLDTCERFVGGAHRAGSVRTQSRSVEWESCGAAFAKRCVAT